MKEKLFVSFLIFLSNINEHYPDSNDYNKNSLVNYNIYIQMDEFEGRIIHFSKLYNGYGIKFSEPTTIDYISYMYFLNSTSNEIKEILPDTFIFVDSFEIFEKVINQIATYKSYTSQESIVILVHDNILSNLNSEEVMKYKQISKCLIITYTDIPLSPFYEIKDNVSKMRKMKLNIDLTYSRYPINGYISLICILFLLTNIGLFLFVINYMKIDDKDKLGIHIIIIILFILLNISYIFTFVEILLSPNILFYKLISIEYFIIKIIKVIFINLTKNSIMLIFLLNSRGYCILFFDKAYFCKYIKIISFIALFDYGMQILFSFFNFYLLGFIYFKDIYNILYYILLGIYIYNKGKNISLGLLVLLYIIEHNIDIGQKTQEEKDNIIEVIKMKTLIRKKVNIFSYINIIIGVITPLIYFVFSFWKGSTIYDIIILIDLSIIIICLSRLLFPKQLLNNYTLTYEELLHGIPEDFLNEYLFRISSENNIGNERLSKMIPNNSPIIIINPLQKLYNEIIYNNNDEKNIPIDSGETGETFDMNDIEVRLINSISETGQIGFVNNRD